MNHVEMQLFPWEFTPLNIFDDLILISFTGPMQLPVNRTGLSEQHLNKKALALMAEFYCYSFTERINQ